MGLAGERCGRTDAAAGGMTWWCGVTDAAWRMKRPLVQMPARSVDCASDRLIESLSSLSGACLGSLVFGIFGRCGSIFGVISID